MYIMKMLEKNQRLLLHACCAPCSAVIIDELQKENVSFAVFFYNPNIFPIQEYDLRKQELIKYCNKKNVEIIIESNGENEWKENIKGLEKEPEKGKRCEICFYHRLYKAGKYAKANGFDIFATSLSSSRMKSVDLINKCGKMVSKELEIDFLDENWKKNGRQEKSIKISNDENFYRQKYCGCEFSIRK